MIDEPVTAIATDGTNIEDKLYGGLLEFTPRPIDVESIPIGAVVRTPLGQLARVTGYRGRRRQHREYLVLRYLTPRNRAFAVVLLLPELVEVVRSNNEVCNPKEGDSRSQEP